MFAGLPDQFHGAIQHLRPPPRPTLLRLELRRRFEGAHDPYQGELEYGILILIF